MAIVAKKCKVSKQEDYEIRWRKIKSKLRRAMVRKDDGRVIGWQEGSQWVGPHPWRDEPLYANSAQELRDNQRYLASEEF